MKPFTAIAVFVLFLIALMQLVRFLSGWDLIVNGIVVPVWASGIAFVIALMLAIMVWREARTATGG